jgi:hypothetical protein
MLTELFSSQARVSILELFLLNPADNFYQREIAAICNLPIRAVQTEVQKLEKIGLINLIIPCSLLQGYCGVPPPCLPGQGWGRIGGGGKISVHPPLYPLPSLAGQAREGKFDNGYPTACCRVVH